MDLVKPPQPLVLSGNTARNWCLFKQRFELFLQATETAKALRSEPAKTALLLTIAGEDALEVFNNFSFSDDESKEDYGTVTGKFEEYCRQQQNEVHERYVFRTRTQAEGEPFEHFARDLRKLAQSCNFGDLSDSMVRDQIVFGTVNPELRKKLLKVKDLTLRKAEEICKAEEVCAEQNNAWVQAEKQVAPTEMRSSNVQRAQCKCLAREELASGSEQSYAQPETEVAQIKTKRQFKCSKCNRIHERGRCPAFGKTCFSCRGANHFSACCRKGPQISAVRDEHADFEILDVGVGNKADWVIDAQVASQLVSLKVDTDSQANLLPYTIFQRFKVNQCLKTSPSVLCSYSGNVIKHIGVATLPVTVNNRSQYFDFFIVRKSNQAILGLSASETLGLVSRTVDSVHMNSTDQMTKEFPELFQGIGCLARPYHMVLREEATPVVQPVRRVPLALREPLREELDRMERAGIIVKVSEPTDWGNNCSWLTCYPDRHLSLPAAWIASQMTSTYMQWAWLQNW
ncbi:uncharacterized protein [Dermacentor albipictus]|uniref:uncharacterized protein isoform X1 n=2 Tax=Dermacentor albipictus TaxID=60249 RepID=UPI0038FC1A06